MDSEESELNIIVNTGSLVIGDHLISSSAGSDIGLRITDLFELVETTLFLVEKFIFPVVGRVRLLHISGVDSWSEPLVRFIKTLHWQEMSTDRTWGT